MASRLNLTETHFEVQHAGPLLAERHRRRLAQPAPPQDEIQWSGGVVVIKPRDLPDLVEGLEADGFDVRSL